MSTPANTPSATSTSYVAAGVMPQSGRTPAKVWFAYALIGFALGGKVLWSVGLCMAAGQFVVWLGHALDGSAALAG